MTRIPARAALPAAALAASILAAAPQAFSQTRTIDMRDCPLDTVTFIDPWAGGEFKVERVGTNYVYLCGSELRDQPPEGEECMGPYGDLILKGVFRKYEGDEPKPLFAVWTATKALPCCGWSASDEQEAEFLSDYNNFRWLEAEDAPKLGQFGFASIDWDETMTTADFRGLFGNPKYAMICELPAE